jgi:hypothetical protein
MWLIVLFALSLSGCVTAGKSQSRLSFMLPDAVGQAQQEKESTSRGVLGSAANYLANRGLDFADIFKINVGIGPGLSANVRATQIIQVGAGYTGATKVGLSGRHAGFWNENSLEAGIPLIVYGRDVEIIPGGGGIAPINSYRQQFLWKFEFRDPEAKEKKEGETYDTDYDRQFFEVGASVHALFPAFEFSINLKELIDFLVGFTTIDLCGDDSK